VYEDDEYLVVRALLGYYKASKVARKYYGAKARSYHNIFVFGKDENGKFWVHRLPWGEDYCEDENFVFTKEKIRELMGFKHDLTEITTLKKDEPVRIHGDLTLTKVRELEEFVREVKLRNYYKVVAKLKEQITEEEVVRVFESVKKEKRWRVLNAERKEIIKDMIIQQREREINEIVERETAKEIEELKKTAKQMNMRIGNHIVIVSRAVCPPCYVDFLVFDSASVFFLHDEHENVCIKLGPGMYYVSLLRRHA